MLWEMKAYVLWDGIAIFQRGELTLTEEESHESKSAHEERPSRSREKNDESYDLSLGEMLVCACL